MKKLFLILAVILILLLAGVYFFIPTNEEYTDTVDFNCTQPALLRYVTNPQKWSAWFPGKKINDSTFVFNNYTYTITRLQMDGFAARVSNTSDSITGRFNIQFGVDKKSGMAFSTTFTNGTNPIQRVSSYYNNKDLKNNITSFLAALKTFFDKEENVYGMKVVRQMVTDSTLMATKQIMNHYPTMQEVYSMINEVDAYVKKNGGVQKNPPMLNVYQEAADKYYVMVAIPTNKALPSQGKFELKTMILGYILVAEIKGGINTLRNAEQEMYNYAVDYGKTSPAIPYQSLITNRQTTADSTQWITKLYFPIMY
jgi:effector-binding domain-containing protein